LVQQNPPTLLSISLLTRVLPQPRETKMLRVRGDIAQRRCYVSVAQRLTTLPSHVTTVRLPKGCIFVMRTSPLPSSSTLPPALKPPRDPLPRLNLAQKYEMLHLRRQDSGYWTRKRLAEKFGCSGLFVSITAPAPRERLEEVKRKEEEQRKEWGWKKREIRENRRRRRELW